jgi:E3 ubiquitin-protein ligase SHPRH
MFSLCRCVTGTPIEKSLDDMQGLLLFLQSDPYSYKHWWKQLLYEPYLRGERQPLERLLCEVLWRTAKKDVLHQINIPDQTYVTHWLSFSPVEEHFYRTQHIECSHDAVAKLRKFNDLKQRLSEIDRNTLNTLLNPVLRLRQSCCHPQAVRGQFISLQKSTMTMEQLLEQMIKKITVDCEDNHRQYIAALSGLAGIAMISEEWKGAAMTYRDVLRWVLIYIRDFK